MRNIEILRIIFSQIRIYEKNNFYQVFMSSKRQKVISI